MNTPLLEKLQEFGLTDKEARVYLASLELGSTTADKISKQADVNRSTTYVQIEQLMEMGLMSTHEEGKKTLYTAESPDNLKRLFERKQEELKQKSKALENFVPELSRIYDSAGERPVVRFFQGKSGVATMRNEILKAKDKRVLVATSFDDLWNTFSEEELMKYSTARAKKKITSYVLYTKSGEDVAPVPPSELRRVSEKEFPFECDVYIFDNKVAMASLKEPLHAVIIESAPLSKSMHSIFRLAWRSSEVKK